MTIKYRISDQKLMRFEKILASLNAERRKARLNERVVVNWDAEDVLSPNELRCANKHVDLRDGQLVDGKLELEIWLTTTSDDPYLDTWALSLDFPEPMELKRTPKLLFNVLAALGNGFNLNLARSDKSEILIIGVTAHIPDCGLNQMVLKRTLDDLHSAVFTIPNALNGNCEDYWTPLVTA